MRPASRLNLFCYLNMTIHAKFRLSDTQRLVASIALILELEVRGESTGNHVFPVASAQLTRAKNPASVTVRIQS